MNRKLNALLALTIVAAPLAAYAADETQFGVTVGSVAITKNIPSASLGLKNMAASKIAAKRDLVVTGTNPRFTVTGQAFCKQGARLTAVQAIIGRAIINQTELIAMAPYGKSAKDSSVAGRNAADVELQVELKVTRRAGDALVDFTFNPAREYERKLTTYVAKGNTAAEYLRETQAYDMDVTVNLVAWCKMDANANSVLAGKTYPGVASRKVPVTILYNGDPAIVDGPAPRGKVTTREAEGAPPVK
ncbi:hypothetical protein ACFSAG_13370 [Sphingorhabdus buctiana]|uniref:DUF3108 domain-containing protein n=1 Tax=Sphingorhabdus buctiana TaxID=1508805 RepID=A0ABW4MI26_9SPHN